VTPAELRAAYAMVLRAIADAVEGSPAVPLPSGHLSLFPPDLATVTGFLAAVPLPWKGEPPEPGGDFYAIRSELGDYLSDGIGVNVFARPEDVATAQEPAPVMVTGWAPLPEVAELLAEGGEAS
jgi:hypothetical protein